ncbi:hypothetical protein HBA55_11065 [Pseudomaricurvus alkylphenolicus]|jgi:LPS-assembly lipoprotein|uniref:LPS-assembly lipoprotein LptE n=1 Tax=Pseudomaricurvus alkylphenolicus TaxID=1306991 RepID=UPI00141EC139|nr:LPS assembly lipoprotein LptE [Pseudomaricurvus alkylphenolicus]NIB40131.1 hypothetical protein [Pseudomaricurvus alkylphenolicus]
MKKLLLLVLSLSLLTGCGWHLRGSVEMPEGVSAIYVTADNSHGALASGLKKALVAYRIEASDTMDNAQYRIHLSNEQSRRRTASVGNNALAAEYELNMSVDYRIEDATGKVLVPRATAEAQRVYDFDRDAVVAKAQEEKLIDAEMRNQLIQQILRRLRFLSSAAANKGSTPAESGNG